MSSVPPQSKVTFSYPSTDSLSSEYQKDFFPRALSPTSSIKGCFVRSRPTSAEFSDYGDYTDFSALALTEKLGKTTSSSSSEAEGSTVDDIVLKATSNWARDKIMSSDARSIMAPSVLTTGSRSTIVPVRIIRRSPADIIDDPPAANGKDKSRRHTWPSYKKIRKTVTSILHRKDVDKDAKSPAPEVMVERLKSSSASLFTKKRRVTVGEMDSDTRPRIPRALSIRSRVQNKGPSTRAELRRSRSFAGFTSALAAIDDADDDVDEVTAEARGVVEAIGRRWMFEEIPEDRGNSVDTGLFERWAS
ncbi:hypothetical protein BD779DRAFT_1475642 [Infundibulicybe gibba]|nr:hypothetical protein BD779DRAFT_1475642 [Infundibulicybe gibba]